LPESHPLSALRVAFAHLRVQDLLRLLRTAGGYRLSNRMT
jgi:hypothetical protein